MASSWNEWQGWWLIRRGWVEKGRVATAWEVARSRTDGALVEVLVEQGALTPDQARQLVEAQALADSEWGARTEARREPAPAAARLPDEGALRRSTLDPGQRFAGLHVVAELSRGGMGVVYRAETPDGALKALKILPRPELELRERFRREAKVAATLAHPGLIRVEDYGDESGVAWLRMPFVKGQNLAEWSRARFGAGAETPLVEAVEIIAAVAEALDYMHGMGVIHRDVKPANIVLEGADGSHPRPILIDLGLVRRVGVAAVSGLEESLSRTGELLGTPAFMSPEQLDSDGAVGVETDVWGLGATLFFALTGEEPFTAGSVFGLVLKVEESPAPRLSERRSDVPADVDELARAMLARDPAARPSMREVARTLGTAALALRRVERPAAGGRGLGPVLGLVLGLAALVLIALGLMALAPDRSPRLLLEVSTATSRQATFRLVGRVENGGDGGELRVRDQRTRLKPDGRFEVFVPLEEGENPLSVEFWPAGAERAATRASLSITRDRTPPSLELQSLPPRTGADQLRVRGVSSEPGTVELNGARTELDSQGRFELVWPLTEGENVARLVLRDSIGNAVERRLTVTRMRTIAVPAGQAWPDLTKPLDGPTRLALGPGDHVVASRIRTDVILEPAEPGGAPVRLVSKPGSADMIHVAGARVELLGVTLDCRATGPRSSADRDRDGEAGRLAGSARAAAVRLISGALILSDCVITSRSNALVAWGPPAEVTLRRCELRDIEQAGLRSMAGTDWTVEDCTFRDVRNPVMLQGRSRLRFRQLRVERGRTALYADGGSRVEGEGLIVLAPEDNALRFLGESSARLKTLAVEGGWKHGLEVDRSDLELESGRIVSRSAALWVQKQARVHARTLSLRSDKGVGLWLRDSDLRASGLTVRACGGYGADLHKSVAVLEDLEIEGCVKGGLKSLGSEVFITGARVRSSRGDGLRFSLGKVLLDRVTIAKHRGVGLRQSGPGPIWLRGLTIRECEAAARKIQGAVVELEGDDRVPTPPEPKARSPLKAPARSPGRRSGGR